MNVSELALLHILQLRLTFASRYQEGLDVRLISSYALPLGTH